MNDAGVALDSDRLIALLGQQLEHYRRLQQLSEQQRALISSDHPEQLLTILRDRQNIVLSLAKLNEELGPYRRTWDSVYSRLRDEHRSRATELLRQINDLLRVILRSDQEDGALLAARKQTVSNEINLLAGGRTVNAAYVRAAAGRPAGADLTG